MFETNPCYVAVDHTSVGPVPIDLVIRGIEQRKIPPEAMVCEVGGATWVPLSSVPVFHAAVVRSYPPPPPDSAEAQYWHQQGFHFPSLGALPSFDDAVEEEEAVEADGEDVVEETDDADEDEADDEEADEADDDEDADEDEEADEADDDEDADEDEADDEIVEAEAVEAEAVEAEAVEAQADETETVEAQPDEAEDDRSFPAPPAFVPIRTSAADLDVDVEWSAPLAAPPVDWSHRFHSYFLVGDDVQLPAERALLESLSVASLEMFRHDEALWNLALCLAFGSDEVGEAAAAAFFGAVAGLGTFERLEWMHRTLLGDGFVPSGIPQVAGRRAFERLRSSCPPSLNVDHDGGAREPPQTPRRY
jgi:hypothetical protein